MTLEIISLTLDQNLGTKCIKFFFQYWSDFKNKLKKKLKLLERAKRQGNSSEVVKPLSKLEKRVVVILGAKFAKVRNRRREDWDNSFQVNTDG